MKNRTISLAILLVMVATVGFCQEQTPHSASPKSSTGTNSFTIHLQEGFYQNHEVVITVDGHEIYRDIPKTKPERGLAAIIPVTATSSHPMVSFAIPSTELNWSKQIDLSAGVMIGISIKTNNVELIQQAKSFNYL